ncbi:MAG TPA: hypothetical protein VE913_06060 [Longimicrobium sp.]|nr:hypothetical protein [Longimicrobium sp.]
MRIFGWLERTRPIAFVITDGSGGVGEGRIESTRALLARTGARPSTVFGRVTDRDIYARMLDGDHSLFTALVDEIADGMVADGVDHLVTDAAEGFNPSHDLCRLLGAAAARLASRLAGREIPHFDFLLVGRPDETHDDVVSMRLSEDELTRKVAAGRAYLELRAEVDGALAKFGVEAFRTEVLRRAADADPTGAMEDEPPYYEIYGEQQVAAGRYDRVLRYLEHFRPAANAIWAHVERRGAG